MGNILYCGYCVRHRSNSPQLQLVTLQLKLAIGSPQLPAGYILAAYSKGSSQLQLVILAGFSTGLPHSRLRVTIAGWELQLVTAGYGSPLVGGGYLLAEPDLRAGHGPHLPHVELAGVRDQAGLS